MSQSDYIRHKKVSNELKYQSDLPPVLQTNDYIEFKEYALENTIQNTKINYNQLIPSNTYIVYGMEKKPTNCPTFTLCSNTQSRPNRVPIIQGYSSVRPSRPLITLQGKKPNATTHIKAPFNLPRNLDLCKCSTL